MPVFLTLLLTPFLASILFIATAILYPIVFAIIAFGVFAIDYSMSGLMIALVAGVVGLVLLKLDYPPVPLVLGLILGPMLERNIRRTTIQSQGNLMVFIERPIALVLFIMTILVIAWPLARKIMGRKANALLEDSNSG